jgi:orotidine-5'-phosphate decarboxylase
MAFDAMDADAITLLPYLGWEANKPFLNRADKGIFVLCRTSNPGAGEFQDLLSLGDSLGPPYLKLYERVADHVANPETWNRNGNCGLVTGATYPGEIEAVRHIVPDLPLLIPGIGKQGGDLEASVKAARHRFIINSSSGIIFADDPRAETLKLHEGIHSALATLG